MGDTETPLSAIRSSVPLSASASSGNLVNYIALAKNENLITIGDRGHMADARPGAPSGVTPPSEPVRDTTAKDIP
ncbi:hypothetical protein [Nocardia aurantia]|uniref:hypothetical protein n=1 Tax=Nocardia aurantia TaxID=2585199 RepID=UPI001885B0D4|nr:hypothetical protein [Nocardia aurantia]